MDSGAVFTLNNTQRNNPAVDEWLSGDPAMLFGIGRRWFLTIRACGDDVTETIHDGCPTACIGDAAFAYVNVFKAHTSVGFFYGASLDDPSGLLEGNGKRMRHVKLKVGEDSNEEALQGLIRSAYEDIKVRLGDDR